MLESDAASDGRSVAHIRDAFLQAGLVAYEKEGAKYIIPLQLEPNSILIDCPEVRNPPWRTTSFSRAPECALPVWGWAANDEQRSISQICEMLLHESVEAYKKEGPNFVQ